MIVTQRNILQEVKGIVVGGSHILQFFHCGYAVLFHLLKDLVNGTALRECQGHSFAAGGSGTHVSNQGSVVHIRVQIIHAGLELAFAFCDGGKHLEYPLVLDQPRIIEHIHHIIQFSVLQHLIGFGLGGSDAVFLHLGLIGHDIKHISVQGQLRGQAFLVQRQYVIGHAPAEFRQRNRGKNHNHHVDHGDQDAENHGAAATAASAATGLLLIGFLCSTIIIHKILLPPHPRRLQR